MSDVEIVEEIAAIYDPVEDGRWDILLREKENGGVHVGLREIAGTSVVIFRGSITPLDWLDDAESELFGFIGGFESLGPLPLGFMQGMTQTFRKLAPLVKSKVIIGGHSLGSARAAIFGGMLVSHGTLPSRVVLCGCPRPGMATLRAHLSDVPVANYKNGHDYVTDVPSDPPYEQVRPFTCIDGGQDSVPGPFMYHHVQYYVAGVKRLLAS